MLKGPALNALSIDQLVALREQVEATITTKVIEERRTMQAELGNRRQTATRRQMIAAAVLQIADLPGVKSPPRRIGQQRGIEIGRPSWAEP
jgi:hypothetical protein